MKIDQETIEVLARCEIDPHDRGTDRVPAILVKLPAQLDRPLYQKVNKVLEAAGGKWNRSMQAHVFPDDASEILEQAILTGEIGNPKQELGVFYTPPALAHRAAGLLKIEPAQTTILEPSAGMGALATACRGYGSSPTCLDVLEKHVHALRAEGFTAWQTDFMKWAPQGPLYDRVIMNPPFAKIADDARHFHHALQWLKPGGRIVAIMSAAVTFRDITFYREIRELEGVSIESLPAGSFKTAGTGVNTALVVYDKPKE